MWRGGRPGQFKGDRREALGGSGRAEPFLSAGRSG